MVLDTSILIVFETKEELNVIQSIIYHGSTKETQKIPKRAQLDDEKESERRGNLFYKKVWSVSSCSWGTYIGLRHESDRGLGATQWRWRDKWSIE